jgi:hypothetical protein
MLVVQFNYLVITIKLGATETVLSIFLLHKTFISVTVAYFSKTHFQTVYQDPKLRLRAHQGNRKLQRNRDLREISPISSRQLVSRLAGAQ